MPEIIIYLLKANLSLVLFYLGYRFLLRRLTFYRLNRFYLLFGLLFSAGYPLVDISGWMAARQAATPEVIYFIPNWEQVPVREFNWWPLIVGLFWLGVICFGWQLLVRLISLWKLHAASQPATWRLFRYRQVFDKVNPFTFWRNIYLNIQQHDEPELAEIFSHEQVHARELHTVDTLLAELCRVFCWFNPGAWLLRHAVHENLEYMTDSKVLQSGVDKKTYQYHLLKVTQYVGGQPEIANHFNFKSLKRRIAMMNRKKSSALQLGNYVFTVPVIAVLVLVFSVTRAYQQKGTDGGVPDSVTPGPAQQLPTTDTLRIEIDQPMPVEEAERPENTDVQFPAAPSNPVLPQSGDGSEEEGSQRPVTAIFIGEADSTRTPLFVVDGIPMKESVVKEMDPEDIASISVWTDVKDNRLASALYGSAADRGLVVISTKAAQNREVVNQKSSADTAWISADTVVMNLRPPEKATTLANSEPRATGFFPGDQFKKGDFDTPLFIIDGKEGTAESVQALPTDRIKSVVVLKGKHAKEKYGGKGDGGVVEITTVK